MAGILSVFGSHAIQARVGSGILNAVIRPDAVKVFAHLDARYRAPLMSFFLRRVGSRTEAEDLTQEVFLRIVRRGSIENLVGSDAFIFKVAMNILRDRARRRETRRNDAHVGLPEDEITDHPAATPRELVEEIAPERVVLGRESLAEVVIALDELDPRTRDIFILHRLEKMKQRDIAERLGVSVSAVEKHIVKAAVHLAKRLGAS